MALTQVRLQPFLQISHCVALKLALVSQFGHFQVGLHGFHCHVQLAAISISHKGTGLNFEYANDNLHLPKNPLGLIVNGLCFSTDNVFSIRCIHWICTVSAFSSDGPSAGSLVTRRKEKNLP